VLGGWYKENRLKRGFPDENINNIFRQYDLGILSEDDVASYFSKYDGIHSTKEEVQEEIDSHINLNKALMLLIKKLRQQGFKTALLSNANNAFFEEKVYIKYPDFKDLFDEIIVSSSVQMVKPNADIFLYALRKINSKPEESLFIDDSKINVDAAIKLGMNGLVYTDISSFIDHSKNLGIDLTD